MSITTDASPWGLGAILSVNHQPVEYFAVPTTAEDARRLGLTLAQDSTCQQGFEALVVLVALRQWRHYWQHTRSVISVQSDNKLLTQNGVQLCQH